LLASFEKKGVIMGIISKKDEEFFENVEYFSEIIDRINDIQANNNYSDEEMDNDLDVALWRAYVYINLWNYKGYAKAEKILKKVEIKGKENPIWCYRYAASISKLRKHNNLNFLNNSYNINKNL